jgi:uncharacterized protein (DUF2345 family)
VLIDGGNVTFECPGTLTVKAGKKSFTGAASCPMRLPELPRAQPPKNWISAQLLDPEDDEHCFDGMGYQIEFNDGSTQSSALDASNTGAKHVDVSASGVKRVRYEPRPAKAESPYSPHSELNDLD